MFKGVGLRLSCNLQHCSPCEITSNTPRSGFGAIAACSAEAVCASARSGPARQCSRPPQSGGLWCGLLVPKKGENAGLPACLIGGEIDLSGPKNDRI